MSGSPEPPPERALARRAVTTLAPANEEPAERSQRAGLVVAPADDGGLGGNPHEPGRLRSTTAPSSARPIASSRRLRVRSAPTRSAPDRRLGRCCRGSCRLGRSRVGHTARAGRGRPQNPGWPHLSPALHRSDTRSPAIQTADHHRRPSQTCRRRPAARSGRRTTHSRCRRTAPKRGLSCGSDTSGIVANASASPAGRTLWAQSDVNITFAVDTAADLGLRGGSTGDSDVDGDIDDHPGVSVNRETAS